MEYNVSKYLNVWIKVRVKGQGQAECSLGDWFNEPAQNNRCVLIATSRLSIEVVELSFYVHLPVYGYTSADN